MGEIRLDQIKLAEAIRDNELTLARLFADHTGGAYEETATCSFYRSGVEYYTGVFRTEVATAEVPQLVDRMQKRFPAGDLQWWIWPTDKPKDLHLILEKLGFSQFVTMKNMALPLKNIQMVVHEDIVVSPVRSVSEYPMVREVRALGSHLPRSLLQTMDDAYEAMGFSEKVAVSHYVAWIDSEPAGTGTLTFGGGVAGIHNVATIPKHRGKGVGRAVMTRMILDAANHGVDYAVLVATDMGVPMYQKLGFLECGRMQTCVLQRD